MALSHEEIRELLANGQWDPSKKEHRDGVTWDPAFQKLNGVKMHPEHAKECLARIAAAEEQFRKEFAAQQEAMKARNELLKKMLLDADSK